MGSPLGPAFANIYTFESNWLQDCPNDSGAVVHSCSVKKVFFEISQNS